ncbi:LysR family transcriptional regulator [Bacteriovorax sp. PP10]|uniref:LysR family transcriptional regulator n=1 Tax=Bacteriovorax antarcticus TaxID=3088717 RepID=A0ABU5VXT4_9BACT|nr:LysR family transcriptional regulator [Bacteriovorax sp. PP10]MEA9357866.1 LysR family transcriptional regulator [Bacteriovorax sp. PP10]
MTLEQLLTIDAIVKEGSFKAAADYLHKSQPSISMAVKKLEEEYQINLFSRDEYRPSLTADGRVFYDKAKLLIREFRELEALAEQMSKGVESEIRVSIDAVSPVSLVLKFLKDFFSKHPATRLTLKFEVLSGTIERLIDGDVNIAITPKPQVEYTFDSRSITMTKMITVISTQLIKDEEKVTDVFLRSHNQIILADSARRIAKINSGVLAGSKSLTVTDMGFKKELIMQGLGWGGLPYGLVKDELASKKLTRIETALIKDRDIEIFIVRDASKPMGPVMKELWERAEEGAIG